jgi:NTP pyrophosphatase (non-canonical NTP hydrolase)
MTKYSDEALQVSAVAAAMVEDDAYGEANYWVAPNYNLPSQVQGGTVLREVSRERIRQDEKWGPQHHDKFTWFIILMEEVGELADEVLALDEMPEDWTAPEQAFAYEVLLRARAAGKKAEAWLERKFGEDE